MEDLLQPGHHPDADQLSAFAERALPPHEQQQTLAHLAGCPDCRAVVFFSQQAGPAEFPQPIASARPWFFGWNLGWNLVWPAAAALACLVLLTIRFHNAGAPSRPAAAPATKALVEPQPAPLPTAPVLPASESSARPASPTTAQPKPIPANKQPLAVDALSPASSVTTSQVAVPQSAVAQTAAASQDATALAPQQRLFRNYGQSSQTFGSPLPAAAPSPPVTMSLRATSTGSAAISGQITDQTGAFVPHARITGTNTETGAQVGRESDVAGRFSLAPLQPGNYTVEAAAPGFQRLLQENVRVAPLQVASLNLKLAVGSQSTTITVTDAPPLLDATDVTLGGTIANQLYTNLPLAARDPTVLQHLTPGVQKAPPPASSGGLAQEVYAGPGQQTLSENYSEGVPASNVAASAGAAYAIAATPSAGGALPRLPSHLPALTVVASAGRRLAIDSAGALFRSEDAGVTWLPVSAPWQGRARTLRLAPERSAAKAAAIATAPNAGAKVAATPAQPAVFELTTDLGAAWTSSDGQTWKLQ
jgi:hypothetical protein